MLPDDLRVNGTPISRCEFVDKKVLIDTGIWVYAELAEAPEYNKSLAVTISALQGLINGFVSTQSLAEFFAALTDPRSVEVPAPPEAVYARIESLWRSKTVTIIAPSEVSVMKALFIAKEKGLTGPAVQDCLLAVTAREHDVDVVWTTEPERFTVLGLIPAQDPLAWDWSFPRDILVSELFEKKSELLARFGRE
jgi:predicted nucleic acid-binding protein